MQPRNDIYSQESRELPRRRGAGHGGSGRSTKGSKSSSSYGPRERRSPLTEDLPVRSSRSPRGRRRRSPNREMRKANKWIVFVLIMLLVGYVGLLGYSFYNDNQMVEVDATPVAPPSVEDIAEPPRTPEPEEEPHRAASTDAMRAADLMREWREALAEVPRAMASHERGDTAEELQRLEQVLFRSPHVVEVKLALADIYADQKRWADARDMYERVLETDPLKEGVRLKWAQSLLALRHFEAALSVALWILEDDSFLEGPNHVASAAYLAMDQVTEAIPHLRRQIAINRDNVIAQNNLAVAYARIGDHRRAIALFRDVLAADPGQALTYFNLAVSHAQQEEVVSAVEVLEQAMERFGAGFVGGWLSNADFDPIRDEPAFQALSQP